MTTIRRLAVAVAATLVVALVAVLAASLGGDDGPGVDEARLDVDGSATVTSVDGTTETVTGAATLAFGDQVTIDDGTATMTLAGGEQYELRSGPTPSSIEVGAPPTLTAGDALVSGGYPAQIRHGSTTVSALGAMKLVSSVPRVVSYAGRARIDGAGELEEVLGLRQVVLTSSAVPEPLVYDGADAWDRRYLADAIAFGTRLEALARGYTADLGGRTPSASFYEAVIPALADEREFGADLVGERDVGETIVGAAIVVQGRDGTFRDRWQAVFTFRDQGAAWGIVALDQGVSSAPLLDTVELAVGAPPPTTPPTTTAPTSPTTTAVTTTIPPTDPAGPTTTTPPEPEPSPPTTGLLDPVLDPVGDILDELLGVLGL